MFARTSCGSGTRLTSYLKHLLEHHAILTRFTGGNLHIVWLQGLADSRMPENVVRRCGLLDEPRLVGGQLLHPAYCLEEKTRENNLESAIEVSSIRTMRLSFLKLLLLILASG